MNRKQGPRSVWELAPVFLQQVLLLIVRVCSQIILYVFQLLCLPDTGALGNSDDEIWGFPWQTMSPAMISSRHFVSSHLGRGKKTARVQSSGGNRKRENQIRDSEVREVGVGGRGGMAL